MKMKVLHLCSIRFEVNPMSYKWDCNEDEGITLVIVSDLKFILCEIQKS